MTRKEIIDGLETYTLGRLNKASVCITVEELQRFVDEIKALEQEPKAGWVSTKDNMPIVGEEVLVCDLDGDMYITYLHTDGGWGFDYDGNKIKNVIAWQSLPDPYKGKGGIRMTYLDAVHNVAKGKCIPYRKETLEKLHELVDKLEQDNKPHKAEIEAAYECGKHANKWVSVDERLPEKNGAYLCTVNFADHNFFELAGFANDLSKVVDDYALQNCKYPGWYVSDPEMGYYEMTNIVAWMELPEIYKAKEGE